MVRNISVHGYARPQEGFVVSCTKLAYVFSWLGATPRPGLTCCIGCLEYANEARPICIFAVNDRAVSCAVRNPDRHASSCCSIAMRYVQIEAHEFLAASIPHLPAPCIHTHPAHVTCKNKVETCRNFLLQQAVPWRVP